MCIRDRRYDGQTFILYIIWYGVVRFFIEGTRTDSLLIFENGPKVSQVVAAGCVVVGVVLLVLFRNRNDLSGCGNRYVMESLGLIKTEVDPALKTSTIFGDLPPVEDDKKPETKTEASNEEKESR